MLSPKDFNYTLPEELIAQTPASPRDTAKLLLLNRHTGSIRHTIFRDVSTLLTENDILVLNDSKVFPARLTGTKSTGGRTEVLLLRPIGIDMWEAMSNGLRPSQIVTLGEESLVGEVISKNESSGFIHLKLKSTTPKMSVSESLDRFGQTPIPPYIHSPLSEQTLRQEYQTVYANQPGSAAAPTAGLHFTQELLTALKEKGIGIETVTLHVGPGTFAKLTQEQLASQTLHYEWYDIATETSVRLNAAKAKGKRIIAVGTTATRTLESAVKNGHLQPGPASTNLFIAPPRKFQFVDALITNFHLPQSSLLMLVSAFVASPNTHRPFTTFANSTVGLAYAQAIKNQYRFFSFGDAMFIS